MRLPRLSDLHKNPIRFLCPAAGLLVALALAVNGIGDLLDMQATNWLFQSVGTRFDPSPEIALVTIDEASLQVLAGKAGRWPWPRSYLARLVDACQGAAAVGVDILLLEADRQHPEADAQLAASIQRHGRVVLAGVFTDELAKKNVLSISPLIQRSLLHSAGKTFPGPSFLLQQYLEPIPLFGEATARTGHSNFFPSRDRLLRTYPYLIFTPEGWMPSLALATGMAGGTPGRLSLQELPGTEEGSIRELAFYRRTFPRVSALDLLESSHRADVERVLNGKIALIGVEARGLHDSRPTPSKGEMSGLEIHATALSNVLQKIRLHSLPRLAVWLLTILFALLSAFPGSRPIGKTLLLRGAILLGYGLMSLLAFYLWPLRLPWTLPLSACLSAGICRLGWIARQESRTRKRLEELQRMRRMSSNMLLHDLRSPVSNIRMLLESLQEGGIEPPKIQSRLESALAEGGRLSNMIETILDIERMESGRMKLSPATFEWGHLVRETTQRLTLRAEGRDLAFQVEPSSASIVMMGDPILLGRVLTNLLENALQHATEGSAILCQTSVDDPQKGWLTCRIINHGPVIPPLEQAAIFDPFVQKTRARKGFGLGLAFSRFAILAHGGTLTCVSPVPGEEKGAVFQFAIPLTGEALAKLRLS